MQLEEERVRRTAARRLVPLDELAAFVTARTEIEIITGPLRSRDRPSAER
jgi:hypothetical protein